MNKMLIVLLFGLHGAAAMAQVSVPGGLTPVANPAQPNLPAGLYVQVIDGLIHVTNPVGTQNFSAGQFGYTASINQPPVVVPRNPGLIFTPPPAFHSTTTTTASNGAKSNTVDCEVR